MQYFLAHHLQRRHASTAPEEEEFIPSTHLLNSQERLPGFTGNTNAQKTAIKTTKARHQMQLLEAADMGRYGEALHIVSKMKFEGIKPDLLTYSALMTSASYHRQWLDAWAILDDLLAVGLQPDTAIFNALIQAQNACTSDYLWKALAKMEELGVAPNSQTFDPIIRRYILDNNTELAIQFYRAMKPRNIVPDIKIASELIMHVADAGYPRLALDLLVDFEATSVRRFDYTTWAKCLAASAEALYSEGVIFCWNKFVHGLNLNPGEGVCLSVLDTAARNALPDLATDALRILKNLGIKWEEYHYSSLIEAFCGNKQLKEAIEVLDVMRSQGVEPQSETASIFLEALSDLRTIDSVWGFADEMLQEGKSIDITVLQALVSASVKLGDLQRAIGAYKSLAEYGVSANLSIFNSLLRGCVSASHRDLGDRLLEDMKASHIKPDGDTYESFISLCLTQTDYEDAFFYLEEMKSAGFHPRYEIYSKLVKKCISTGDFRYAVAVKEMKEMGYEPRSDITRMLRNTKGLKKEEGHPSPVAIDGSALQFIETGGAEGAAELPTERFMERSDVEGATGPPQEQVY
ncbi:hypothetical protein C0991_002751 [Blastosporella zonata]|nr:hypothetical protein C0991_002751 [Blastosporella zonata]